MHPFVPHAKLQTSYTIAFTGQFCEEDRNGCGEIQCYEGVECLDVPAPGIGAVCGDCPLGFTGDGLKCYGKLSAYVCITVNPPNKGHVGDNINSHALSLVERLSSSRRFKL